MAHPDAIELLLKDAELTRSWAEFNTEWDEIERLLFVIFDSLVEDDPGATQAIFFSQTSHAARRSMVAALAEYVLRHKHGRHDKLKNILNRVRARSDARNNFTHGLWLSHATGQGNEVIRVAASTNIYLARAYSKPKLKRLASDMKDTRLALAALAESFSQVKFEQRERLSNAGIHPS